MLLQDVCAWTLQLFLWQKYTAEKSTWLSVKYFNNNGLSRVYFLLEPFISRCYAFTYQSRCLCFCMWQHIMKKTCSGHCTLCECHDLCHRCRLPPTFAKAGCENDVGEAKHSSLKAHISTFIFPTVLSSRTSGRVSRWHVSLPEMNNHRDHILLDGSFLCECQPGNSFAYIKWSQPCKCPSFCGTSSMAYAGFHDNISFCSLFSKCTMIRTSDSVTTRIHFQQEIVCSLKDTF